jgi:TPR repeat protein
VKLPVGVLAEQGDAAVQYNLGRMYVLGQGVPQDYVKAHQWTTVAPSHASAENQKEYAEARDSLAKSVIPAQIADTQKLARAWVAAFEQRD